MKHLYIVYQYLIALPIMIVLTIPVALTTMVCTHWKDAMWLHDLQAWWARCAYYVMFIPVTVTGQENVQKDQSYVFVSNHQSFMDVFAIYGWLPSVFKWLMKKELRRIPLIGTACAAAGHIYVDRTHPRAAMESLAAVEKQLVGGISTVIFPEGTRTRTGEVGPFKRGAFQIAWDLKLPVVPITLKGCFEDMPYGQGYIRHDSPVSMHIGKPIDLNQFADAHEAIEAVRQAVING